MTSKRFNARKAQAEEEMRIYDALPSAIRHALDNATGSVKASSARNALLRGVPEEKVIEILTKERK